MKPSNFLQLLVGLCLQTCFWFPVSASRQLYFDRVLSQDQQSSYKPMEEIVVGVVAPFFGEYRDLRNITEEFGCSLGNTQIQCLYRMAHPGSEVSKTADGLFYHIPSFHGHAVREKDGQLLIAMSMESAEYYPALRDKQFMKQFDLEMTYRMCSHSVVHYFYFDKSNVDKTFLSKPLPYEQKKTALVYVNSNCHAKSGRSQIMRDVMALKDVPVPVHSWGRCDQNMAAPHSFDKVKLMREYKFCVAMENSITKDYITEKLWQAFEAGCVPVYLGPPNTWEFLPDPEAIIDYNKLGSPQNLMTELSRLANDRAAYEAKLAWKYKPIEQLSPIFQKFLRTTKWYEGTHTWCQICQILLKHRYNPQQYTTCMFNSTWLELTPDAQK